MDKNTKLPLFPLELVLFPGMMLPLHIFEPRYKAMIKACINSGDPFGVVLAKETATVSGGVTQPFKDNMYSVGTTAHIKVVENLDDGRMNLITVGQDRFIIRDVGLSEESYFVGNVDPYPIQEDEDGTLVDRFTQRLRPVVERYLMHLAEASGEDLSETTIPTEPAALAYLAGAAMQGPLKDKQRLLSANSLASLVAKAANVLDREDQILAYMLKAYSAHNQVERLPFIDYSLN